MFEKLQFWKKSSSLDSSDTDFPMPDFSDTSTNSLSEQSQSSSQNSMGNNMDMNSHPTYPTGIDSTNVSQNQSNSQQPPQNMDGPIHDPFADSMNNASQSGDEIPSAFSNPSQSQASVAHTSPQMNENASTDMSKRDVDLILSRLDLIKSEMENMQHRMIQLEQEVKNHQQHNTW